MRIGLKLILGFLVVALFVGVIAFYAQGLVTESTIRKSTLEEIKFSFENQKGSFVSFVHGDKASETHISDSHKFIQSKLDDLVASSRGREVSAMPYLKELSTNAYNKKLNRDDPESSNSLIDKRDNAFDEFLKKNNKHMTKVSQYKNFWGNETINDQLTQILVDINIERTLLLDFDPDNSDWETVRQEFRQTNDKVVQSLVSLSVDEFNHHISSLEGGDAELQRIKDVFAAQKEITAQITATTFPAVSKEQADIAGVNATSEVTFSEAEAMTILLGDAYEKEIVDLEERGIRIREHHDIQKDGDNKDSIQVLISVIKCQQGLRVNVEDFMSAQLALKDQLDNYYMPLHNEFNNVIDGLISAQEISFVKSKAIIPRLFILAILGIVIFGFFMSHSISKPIQQLTKASERIKKGNLNYTIKVKSKDEIGRLAETFDEMRLGLRDRNDLLNSLLSGFEGKLGKIASILMRRNVQNLAKKNPRILEIIPKEMARIIKLEQELKKK